MRYKNQLLHPPPSTVLSHAPEEPQDDGVPEGGVGDGVPGADDVREPPVVVRPDRRSRTDPHGFVKAERLGRNKLEGALLRRAEKYNVKVVKNINDFSICFFCTNKNARMREFYLMGG